MALRGGHLSRGWLYAGQSESTTGRRTDRTDRTAAASPAAAAGSHEPRTRTVGLALPVVEVEQHRLALGHGAEERAELSERIRTNGVCFVVAEQVALARTLGVVHTEMVKPEVGHDFLQLAVAHHRSRNARTLHFHGDLAQALLRFAQLHAVRPRHAPASSRLVHEDSGVGVLLFQRGRGLAERLVVAGDESVERTIIDALGTQLFVNPPVHTLRANALYIAGPWAECQSVQYLRHLLVCGLFAVGGGGRRHFRCGANGCFRPVGASRECDDRQDD